jgi:hypothetical protein
MVRVMITPADKDGNPQPHCPEYHAEITAEKIIGELETSIISIAGTAPGETIAAGRHLRKEIERILVRHHRDAHSHEGEQLEQHGLARSQTEDAPDSTECFCQDDEQQTLNEIAEAARGTPFEAMFSREDVRAALLAEIHHEIRSQMHVHRTVHVAKDRKARRPRIV